MTETLPFAASLPDHAEIVETLRREVAGSDRWRWMELACSLATGRGDELSDIDAGIGFSPSVTIEQAVGLGLELVREAGPVLDHLVHLLPGWPAETRRLAVVYENGVQLDLVLMPANRRKGLPEGALALVDKDGHLARPFHPPVADPPTEVEAREWSMLAWWALSDVAKYVSRRSLFEAVERLGEARGHMFRLFAAAREIPYPAFGLTSLLDYEPDELADGLEATYALPASGDDVAAAARVLVDQLEEAGRAAGATLGFDLSTPWSQLVRDLLTDVGISRN